MTITLAALNALPPEDFVNQLGGIFEHSPWVPHHVCASRPFASLADLHAAMVAVVDAAAPDRQLALLRAHPELARRGKLTDASTSEQRSQGLNTLDDQELAMFDSLNTAYRARFGFPFIIAVRGERDRKAILAAMADRVQRDPAQERTAALAEVARIARFRLEDLIADAPDAATGWLTLHALDTTSGHPAVALPFSLYRIRGDHRTLLHTGRTNADGRCEDRLLADGTLAPGAYEIIFDIAAWRDGASDPGFYDLVPIRFRIDRPDAHYHIPLLISPYGYTTYRGS